MIWDLDLIIFALTPIVEDTHSVSRMFDESNKDISLVIFHTVMRYVSH